MTKILVVVSSARKGRVAEKVLEYIQADIAERDDVTATIADLKELALPFFDNENIPSSPEYAITNPKVVAWSRMVQDADSIVFITPEYNYTLNAIQKNALDSLGADWVEKPITAVAYGWSGGSLSVQTLRLVLDNLKADVKPSIAQLRFMKELNVDGSLLDEATVMAQIKTAIDEIT